MWPRPAISVNLNAPFVALAPGTVGHARVDVRDSTGHILTGPVRWQSSDPGIIEVRQKHGVVVDLLYHQEGRAVVTATAAGVSQSAILYAGQIPATTRMRIRPNRSTLSVGGMIRMTAFPTDSLGRPKPALWVKWSWSDSSRVRFAGVPGVGEVILQAITPGCVTVTASQDSAAANVLLAIGHHVDCRPLSAKSHLPI